MRCICGPCLVDGGWVVIWVYGEGDDGCISMTRRGTFTGTPANGDVGPLTVTVIASSNTSAHMSNTFVMNVTKGIDNFRDLKPLMETDGNRIDFVHGDELVIRGVTIGKLGKTDFMFYALAEVSPHDEKEIAAVDQAGIAICRLLKSSHP